MGLDITGSSPYALITMSIECYHMLSYHTRGLLRPPLFPSSSTKYIVRIPVAGLEELCNVRPLAVDSPPPGHRSRRQAEAGGSGKAVIYFDKYTLHQVVVDNMNIIETVSCSPAFTITLGGSRILGGWGFFFGK